MIFKGKVNTAICYAKVIEPEAVEQIRRLCDYEMTKGSRIRIMPDVHARKGCTIGTTMTIIDKAVPNVVGVDIGCGMYTVNLGGTAIGSCINTSPAYLHNIVPCLSSITRYQKSAEIAKAALKSNRTVRELVLEKHLMTAAELEQVLDPYAMTEATEDMKQAM